MLSWSIFFLIIALVAALLVQPPGSLQSYSGYSWSYS